MLCRVKRKETIYQANSEDVYDISVEKYHNFILANGTVVHNCDTFQSAQIRQDLAADGFTTEIVSVDRVTKDANGKPICLPYHYLKSSIYERRLIMYQKCDLLTDELIGLERKSDGHVDHTKRGINSKDQSDAVCGATWLASKYSEEYSYNYGDSLDATFEANDSKSELDFRKQSIIDFQNEILNIEKEQQNYYEREQREKQEEYEYFADLCDGIIVI